MSTEKQKILLVDDDAVTRDTIREALEQLNYEVAVADDGEQALAAVEECAPDAVVLDRRMPVMDGNETLKHLRAHEKTKNTPVIMLTGDHDVAQIMESINLGANEYVVKPVSPEDLIVRLKIALEKGAVRREKKKNFEGFEGNSSGW